MQPKKDISSDASEKGSSAPGQDREENASEHPFEIPIVKRIRIDKSAVFYGALALGLMVYTLPDFVSEKEVPIFDAVVDQIGLEVYRSPVFYMLIGIGVWLVSRMLFTLLRRRQKKIGFVRFYPEMLQVQYGKKAYHVLYTNIKKLSLVSTSPKRRNRIGKSPTKNPFLVVPTPRGTYYCELGLSSSAEKEELIQRLQQLEQKFEIELRLEFNLKEK